MKNTHDPWTIYDKINDATNNKCQGFLYGTPRQFPELPIITIDPHDGNFTLIMRVKVLGSDNIKLIINELKQLKDGNVIGPFELHYSVYDYKCHGFCDSNGSFN